MTIPTSVLMKIATIGLSEEQAMAVAEMLSVVEKATEETCNAVVETSREKARERVQRWREKQKCNVTERNETSRNATKRLTRVEDNNKTNNLEDISSLRSDNISIKPDFDREFETEFWPSYPRKVGKGQALKAYRAARKQSDCQTITAGARRYAAERAGQDQQFTRHAATWLNGQGWLDEPASKPSPRSQAPPLTPHQQRHQAAIDAFDRRLGVKRDDEFTGNTLDLERADFGHH